MAERSKATDCKSVSLYSRWFESNFSHITLKSKIKNQPLIKTQKNQPLIKKRKIHKVFGSMKTSKFNLCTRFFTKMLYQQVGFKRSLSTIRTFLTDTPNLFFQKAVPNKQSLFRLLYTRFTNAASLVAYTPTFDTQNVFSYQATVKTLQIITNAYLLYFFKPATEYFYLSRNFRYKTRKLIYYLNFKFRRNRLFINIYNNVNKNYMSLTLGLFLSFLKKKKAFKKNILLKLLAMRFLRKMFISLTFSNLHLRVRGAPTELTKLISTLNKPIIHLFVDPLSERLVDEKSPEYQTYLSKNPPFLTPYIHFIKSKSYTFMKTRKRGRIKRKIRRKLVKLNNATD